MTTLTSISPLDGRYYEKMSGLRSIFSEYGLMRFRALIEIRWLQTLSKHAALPELPSFSCHAHDLLNGIIDHFSEQDAARIKHIEKGINHDVKSVEYFLKERIANNAELAAISEFIHFGCTSEDINNLAYGLMLLTARTQCVLPALDDILILLKRFAHDFASQPMLARTHGQPATPTTVGKEMANFAARLIRQIDALNSVPIFGKFNGASGNYNALAFTYPEVDWQLLSKNFVNHLGLIWNSYTTQIEPHDSIAEFFHALIRINTILIDFNRDIWGYIALNYFQLKNNTHEVGSSAMPHKINPIDFENAEGNLGLANALLEHMAAKLPVSRWQRDLSDSTVLRNIGSALGYCILAYQSTAKGLNKIMPRTDILNRDLDHHWEILAEPIQMMMRRYGIDQPYEKLKSFTRGKPITRENIHAFIQQSDLPSQAKDILLTLTPDTYLGYAEDLAKRI